MYFIDVIRNMTIGIIIFLNILINRASPGRPGIKKLRNHASILIQHLKVCVKLALSETLPGTHSRRKRFGERKLARYDRGEKGTREAKRNMLT
jgi:hypothetical protein